MPQKDLDLPRGSEVSKNQKSSRLQRIIIDSLNAGGYGYFFRLRPDRVFDEDLKEFRTNVAEKGIPNVVGFLHSGQAVFISVRFQETIKKRTKITHKLDIPEIQKSFLLKAHNHGCRVGIAFTVDDAMSIVTGNYTEYPRHPRTWAFLPSKAEIDQKETEYIIQKQEKRRIHNDPVARMQTYNKEVLKP